MAVKTMETTRTAWIVVALRWRMENARAHAFARGLTRGLCAHFANESAAAACIARALAPRARRRYWSRALARTLVGAHVDEYAPCAALGYTERVGEAYRALSPAFARGEQYTFISRRPRVRGRTRATRCTWIDATYALPLGPTIKVRERRTVAALVR